MTEDSAETWVKETFGEQIHDRLASFVALLIAESDQQNLVATSTLEHIWSRHIVDSLQLLAYAPQQGGGSWIDIGSGAGIPAIVIAAASDWPVIAVEPRRLRAEFMLHCSSILGLEDQFGVRPVKVERVEGAASVISARAVASLDKLFSIASHLAGSDTVWILPKGANARSEVAVARQSWHGVFHVERSLSNNDSGIVVAKRIGRR